MTPKELYDWAVERGAEDYDIKVCILDDSMDRWTTDIDEDNLSISNRREQLTIDV